MSPRIRRLNKIDRVDKMLSPLIAANLKAGENDAIIARALHRLDWLVTLAKAAPLAESHKEEAVDVVVPVETEAVAPILVEPAQPSPVVIDLAPEFPLDTTSTIPDQNPQPSP